MLTLPLFPILKKLDIQPQAYSEGAELQGQVHHKLGNHLFLVAHLEILWHTEGSQWCNPQGLGPPESCLDNHPIIPTPP